MRYEFTCFETDLYGKENGNKVSTSFHADTLQTMLERFELFLRGSGFHFTGVVDIVPEEDESQVTINDSSISSSADHSHHYYDFDRNLSPSYTTDEGQIELNLGSTISIDPADIANIDLSGFIIDSDNMYRQQFDER